MDLAIIYDGDCPVCSRYVRYLRLQKAAGTVALINARQGGAEVDSARVRGYELDEGIVLRIGNQYFHGHEAMNALALMSTPVGMINRLLFVIFRSDRLARVAYPLLRSGRNLLLALLGRSKMGY
jgi:predicted DCC family thiol-disulfide oxidoreductase YuxK